MYGAGKLMKTKNMVVECDLRTLRFFGNVGMAALGYGEPSRRLSYLLSLGELLLACRAGGDPGDRTGLLRHTGVASCVPV